MNRREFMASTAALAVGSQLEIPTESFDGGYWEAHLEVNGKWRIMEGTVDSEGNMVVTNSTGEDIPAGTPLYFVQMTTPTISRV